MTNVKRDVKLIRKNINLPSDIVDRVVLYKNKLGIDFTSALIFLLNDGLEENGIFKLA